MFMLSAFISPLVAIGVIWSLCVKRGHHVGKQASKCGIGLGAVFIVACIAQNAVLGEGGPIASTSVALSGGAGFTGGVLVYCAWVWAKVRKRLASTT
jgi:hypothetical protein